jgi:hypothetical protein
MNNDTLMIWSESAAISLTIWLAITVLLMYLARTPAHLFIRSIARTIRSTMRMAACSLSRLEKHLSQRNKEVILAMGKESTERTIEREFERVNTIVNRDLGKYPILHRQINDIINKLEDDYANAMDTPPSPPAWIDAVSSIATIPHNGDPTVVRILESIQQTVEKAHQETNKNYTKASATRHGILKNMLPYWRKVSSTSAEVKVTIDGLDDRSKFIDEQMASYEQIRRGEDHITQMLTSSSMSQFFISGLVLIIAILGGVINFQLIALPMSEMVGGTSQLGPMKTADVAALVIIMVEIAMGLFLMESLRITRLFPIIGCMDDKMRRRMVLITFSILFILASVEASLAYMRDILAMDREAITQSLTGMAVVEAQFRWIPSIGQMVMGFILPFTLAFIAIPLESFIQSLRTVIGTCASVTLRTLGFSARLLGNIAYQASSIVIHLYDMIIMLPLSAEHLIESFKRSDKPTTEKTAVKTEQKVEI